MRIHYLQHPVCASAYNRDFDLVWDRPTHERN